jgi:hypothetical protein
MPLIKFNNKDVAAKFETTVDEDVKINTSDYDGWLSNAKLKTVEAMVKRGSSLVKEVTKAAPAAKVEEPKK